MTALNLSFNLKPDDELAAVFRQILQNQTAILGILARMEYKMSATDDKIAELTQAVADQSTVIESAITLLTGLTTALESAKDDPAQLQAVIDAVVAQKNALADAVVANTPPAP